MYDSIQGESTLAGMACTFIRLAGCPLRCSYCDTPQAIPTDSGEWMQIADLLADVRHRGRPLVLVTGGEPLAQRHCGELLRGLLDLGCHVQLETSGAYALAGLPEGVRKIVDLKTPGSGEVDRNRWENLACLRAGDEIKIVLTGRADYEWARDMIGQHRLGGGDVPVLLSVAWGELTAAKLCQWMLDDHLPARLQVQIHKVIWGAEATGV
ncbi:MAG: radical SAM protein [Mariprofundus sp.]